MNMQTQNNECCPKFNPEKWDKKTFNWENKPFVRESVPTLFHIPFPPMLGKKIVKMWKAAESAQKIETDKENTLVLFRDPSAFKSEIYFSVTGPVPGLNNVNISGTFVSRVFSGPYNAMPAFIKQMNEYLAAQGKKARDYYVHYAYCPKCAKKYGDNYIIIFAQI